MKRLFFALSLLSLLLLEACGASAPTVVATFNLYEVTVQGSVERTCASEKAFGSTVVVDTSKCQEDSAADGGSKEWTISNPTGCACYSVDQTTNLAVPGSVNCADGAKIVLQEKISISCTVPNSLYFYKQIISSPANVSPIEPITPVPTETPTPTPNLP